MRTSSRPIEAERRAEREAERKAEREAERKALAERRGRARAEREARATRGRGQRESRDGEPASEALEEVLVSDLSDLCQRSVEGEGGGNVRVVLPRRFTRSQVAAWNATREADAVAERIQIDDAPRALEALYPRVRGVE